MISKINKIQDFAIFNNFRWDSSIPLFKRYNLIYGWNYSGKTTLSRVFRCFQLGQLHDDYRIATFEVELEDGNKYDQSQLSRPFAVRVFNSDFIKDNLKWEASEEGIEPVLLLGEENIKLEQQLKKYKEELEKKRRGISELRSTVQRREEDIGKGLTEKAREIKNTLSIPDYDKRLFEPTVEEVKDTPETFKLPEEQVQPLIQRYQSTDKKKIIAEIPLSIPDIPNLCSQTKVLLQKTATANIIERLKENPRLEKWVRDGKELHEGKSCCEFCGSNLPDDLFDRLNAHFSDEYNRLMTEIDQLVKTLKNEKLSLELPHKTEFYSEQQSQYEQSREDLRLAIKALNETMGKMIEKLETKKTKPFEAVDIDLPQHSACQIKAAIESDQINRIIKSHHDKTKNFEIEKTEAKDKLQKHWASKFAIEIQYRETRKKIKEIKANIEDIGKEKERTLNKINKVEQQLSDAVKGAGKINEYLHNYFGTDEIKMTVAEDGKYFKIERSGYPANNLSEGEKTAIAFSHFMTVLEDKDTTLANTIVFIDDPVSSLDCNHLFHTYSFIKNRLADCKQLFISTHNYEFFNLIKDWFKDIKKTDGDKSFYLIEKTRNCADTHFKSNLKELPKTFLKYRSEYVYLFSLLYKFNETTTPHNDYLYIMPNLVRRYLEAYVGFRVLGGLSNNLSILIEDETKREKVHKLINEYSHNSSSPRLLHFPDFSECEGVVNIVLNAVKKKDKNHYDALGVCEINCVNGHRNVNLLLKGIYYGQTDTAGKT